LLFRVGHLIRSQNSFCDYAHGNWAARRDCLSGKHLGQSWVQTACFRIKRRYVDARGRNEYDAGKFSCALDSVSEANGQGVWRSCKLRP